MKQRIKFGRGSIKKLKNFISSREKNILVVCGKNSINSNLNKSKTFLTEETENINI